MTTKTDEVLAVLAGGLAGYLDYGKPAGNSQGDATGVERTAPTARPTDRDTALAGQSVSVFDRLTPKDYAIGLVGIAVVGAVLVLSFKALK